MKQKEDLYHLIQSMSRSEKRYFTVEAGKGGNHATRYLELFQLIRNMKTYDEEALREKFPRNLSADKNYLYESLLKTLRDYRRHSSSFTRIRELIMDARHLYKRGLHSQVENRLSEAKALAEEVGDQLALLEINKLEPFFRWHTEKDFVQQVNLLFEERKQLQAQLNAEFKYTELSYLLSAALKNGMDHQAVQQLVNDPSDLDELQQMELPPPEATHLARRRFFQCKALYAQINGDDQQAAHYYAQVVDWWKDYEKYKGEEFSRYILDIGNLINAYYNVEAFGEVWNQIKRLEQEKERNDDTEVKGLIFVKSSIFKILYFINTGEQQDLNTWSDMIKAGINKYQLNEGSRITLIGNMAIYCFCREDFKKCEEWCEMVTKQRSKTETNHKDQIGLSLLWLLAKIEQDDIDATDNALRSVKRFLKKMDAFSGDGFEKLFYELLKDLIPLYGKERKKHLQHIIDTLKELEQKKEIHIPLDLHELGEIWAESRLTGEAILEVIRQEKKK